MDLKHINIYRITHIDNIPHILEYGITHRNSVNANPNFKAIGDASLINTRNNKTVNITNGNNQVIEQITLGDFIPFYFGVRMPMLYVIQHGGNFVPQATNAENIIYMACSVHKITNLNLTFYFSDGHATDILTTFYDKNFLQNLNNIIDFGAIKSSYWGGSENLDIKRKKQAEFLVKEDIPISCIIGYVCYNEKAKNKLIEFGISEKIIKIIPKAYF